MGLSNITDPPTCFPYWHFWWKRNLKSVSIKKWSQMKLWNYIRHWYLKKKTLLNDVSCIIVWWFIIDDFSTISYPYGFLQATMNKQRIRVVAVSSVFVLLLPSVKLLNGLCSFLQLLKKFFFLSKQRGNENQFR